MIGERPQPRRRPADTTPATRTAPPSSGGRSPRRVHPSPHPTLPAPRPHPSRAALPEPLSRSGDLPQGSPVAGRRAAGPLRTGGDARGPACAFSSPTTTASARPGSRSPRRSPPRSPARGRGLGGRPGLRAVGRRALRLLRPADAARAARRAALRRRRLARRLRARRRSAKSSRTAPPDLVLSGVNRGHNVAEDTLYSGTVGGAMEAALHGVRAVALSQYFGPPTAPPTIPSPPPAPTARPCSARLLDAASWPTAPYGVFYNVNFPPVPAEAVRGTRATFQGHRAAPTFGVLPHVAPNGRKFLWLTHGHGNADTPPGLGFARVPRRLHHRDAAQCRPDRPRPHRAACAGARLRRGSRSCTPPNSRCSSSTPCARTG